MAQAPFIELVTHSQKVCRFYKKCLRNIAAWYVTPDTRREQCVIMRARFDENKNIKDLRVAKEILKEGEEELWRDWHPQQKIFPKSPGGSAYQREAVLPDWILDFWDPMEKAMYPKYFALREKRKKEYMKFYDSEYTRYLQPEKKSK